MSDTRLRIRYRTPLEVRSIPNGLWDRWVAANEVPWQAFAATPAVQTTLRHTVRAALRRRPWH